MILPASLRFDANLSMLFADLPLLDRPAAARAAGFSAVELWWPFDTAVPTHREADELVLAFREAGVRLVLLNLFLGDPRAGQHGLLSLDPNETPFRDNVTAVADLVGRLGGSIVNGHVGNRRPGVSAAAWRRTTVANLAWAAPRIAAAGATLVIEALNSVDFPDYCISRTAEAAELARAASAAAGVPVRILFDVYHAAREEGPVAPLVERCAADIGHVQIADVPGRGRPGSGALDFEGIFGLLERVDYTGHVGLEYRPSEDPADTFAWLPAARRV